MIKGSTKNSIIYSLVGVAVVFALWFLLYFVVADAYLIPSPVEVIKASFLNFASSEFYLHLLNTLKRVLLALLISFVLGVTLAIFSSLNAKFEGVMLTIISILRSLPVFAVLLIILVFVLRTNVPVVVCVLSLFPIVYSQTLTYLSTIDPKQKQMLKLYKVPLKKQITSVYLKGYLPLFLKQLGESFSFALKLIVSAEILASVYKSICGDMSAAYDATNVTALFSLTLIICLLGVVVELIGKLISSKMERKYQ